MKKEIPKDKDGLFVDDGTQELVDKDNWLDWLNDFNKQRYKFYKAKEVDLEKEIQDYIYKIPHAKTHFYDGLVRSWREQDVIEIAKHFFELGLKAQKGGEE